MGTVLLAANRSKQLRINMTGSDSDSDSDSSSGRAEKCHFNNWTYCMRDEIIWSLYDSLDQQLIIVAYGSLRGQFACYLPKYLWIREGESQHMNVPKTCLLPCTDVIHSIVIAAYPPQSLIPM